MATHTDHAKCTVWTPRMKMEMSGPRVACALELFQTIELEKMPEVIEKMKAIHQAKKDRAAAKAGG